MRTKEEIEELRAGVLSSNLFKFYNNRYIDPVFEFALNVLQWITLLGAITYAAFVSETGFLWMLCLVFYLIYVAYFIYTCGKGGALLLVEAGVRWNIPFPRITGFIVGLVPGTLMAFTTLAALILAVTQLPAGNPVKDHFKPRDILQAWEQSHEHK